MILVFSVLTLILIYLLLDVSRSEFKPDRKLAWIMFVFYYSVLAGFTEWSWLQYAGSTGPRTILDQFSLYHVYFFMQFVAISFSYLFVDRDILGWRLLPVLLLIEDVIYHIADSQMPLPGDWIDWPGALGFNAGFMYIPGGYVVLMLATVILFGYQKVFDWFIMCRLGK